MSEDPIKSYQDALQKYDAVSRQAEGLAQYLVGLSSIMKDWQHVTVADGKTQFPVGTGKYSINPKDFPTIQQVAETLSLWHQVRHDLRNRWGAIPQDRRVGLQPPHDLD